MIELYVDPKGNWRIEWTESLIFPNMRAGDQVITRTILPKRGKILDRNGKGITINGELLTIGIAPDKFLPVSSDAASKLAELLDINEDYINNILENADVPDWFCPIISLSAEQSVLSASLTSVDSV